MLPTAGKHHWAAEERVHRSVLLADDGTVLSMGLEKFANLGEPGFADAEKRVLADLRAGAEVRFTEKVDGSLIVRSVIGGQVHLRTRGNHHLGDFQDPVMAVIERCYPVLADPSVFPHGSLHFEYCSSDPRFRVVLRYRQDDLLLLGAVEHANLRQYDWERLRGLAEKHSLQLVPAVELPRNLKALTRAVLDWKGREGVVVRSADGQSWIKVKSAGYLALHRLRAQMSVDAVRALCEKRNVQSAEDFRAMVIGQGADWEVLSEVAPMVEAYARAGSDAERRVDVLDGQVELACLQAAGEDRRTI